MLTRNSKTALAISVALAAATVSQLYHRNDNAIPSPTIPIAPDSNTDVLNFSGIGFLPHDSEGGEIGVLNIIGPSLIKAFFPTFIVDWLMPRDANLNESKTIDILDARKDPSLNFEQTGFALITVEELREEKWNLKDRESIEKKYRQLLIPRLQELHPNATRFEFTKPNFRGGKGFGKNKVQGAHLDFYPNDEAIRDLKRAYPMVPENDFRLRLPFSPRGGQFFRYILGEKDTDADEMKVVLGLWMPAPGMRTPVCDFPLAVMDARTLDEAADAKPIVSRMNLLGKEVRNLHGGIKHRPEQRWYYYSYQEPHEMLVFHHYAKDQHRPVNPHSSFRNTRCSDAYETRRSIEFRVAVFLPKENISRIGES